MSVDAPAGQRSRILAPWQVDLAVATVVAVVTGADAAVNDPSHRQADAVTWLLYAVSVLALSVRRRWPLSVAAITGAAGAGWALYGHIGELLNLPVMVALYTVAVRGDRRRTLRTAAVAAPASGVVSTLAGIDVAQPQGAPLLELLWPLVPLLLGEVVRGRRELLREYADRAARAERERERETERRVRHERVLIARELHDVVAHTVSAMTVQASVALEALDSRPELARQAMRQVRASGRTAVRELRTTVAVLRESPSGGQAPGPETARTDPAPRLDQLPELVEQVRAAGVQATLRCETGDVELPALVQLAAYRLVQEALTNVLRHAAAQHVAVSLVRAGDELLVEVSDDGRAGGGPDGERCEPTEPEVPGYGLLGMRERAAALGGGVRCGPQPGGGWRVAAELPLSQGAA